MKLSTILGLVTSASAAFADITLREAAKDFMFGVAGNTLYFHNETYVETMNTTFNTMVAEDGCKFSNVQPGRETFNFTDCDAHLAKAEELGMTFRGHCLLWHGFQPGWFFNLKGDDMKQAIIEHITGVLNHYRGKVKIWDVVNEAISDDSTGENGTFEFRNTNIYQEVPDFVDVAFKTAREVDPDVKLYYNDYNNEGLYSKKTNSVYNLVKDMVDRGVPIDGVGLQYHLHTNAYPTYENVIESMRRFGELGLDVQITEIDVNSVHGVSQEVFDLQAKLYGEALRACLDSPYCKGFLIWGVDDPHSWRADGVPLIFDGDYTPKPAYYTLLNVFKEYNENEDSDDEEAVVDDNSNAVEEDSADESDDEKQN